jgi:hypothetical protein
MTDVPTISLFDSADTNDDSISFFDQLSSSQIQGKNEEKISLFYA